MPSADDSLPPGGQTLEQAFEALVTTLNDRRIRYAIIGGIPEYTRGTLAKQGIDIIDHPTFGRLALNPKVGSYACEIGTGPSKVPLAFVPDDPNQPQACLRRGPRNGADAKSLVKKARDFATSKLLTLRNRTWREDHEKVLAAKQFAARLKIAGLHVYEDGSCVVCFDDGDLFWGHSVVVSVGPRGATRSANIEG